MILENGLDLQAIKERAGLFADLYLQAKDDHFYHMAELGDRFDPPATYDQVLRKLIDAGLVFEVKTEKEQVVDYQPTKLASKENLVWCKSVTRKRGDGEEFGHYEMHWLDSVLLRLDGGNTARVLPYGDTL